MSEVVLIIITVIMAIILVGVNFYILALYIHAQDKGLGDVVYTKILVIAGLTLAQAQALMVPLDVANRSAILSGGLNMAIFWFVIYIMILVFITILIPYAIFFYETDQEDSICLRLGKSLGYTVGAIIFSCLVLFISWAIFRYVDLPYTQISRGFADTHDNLGNISLITPEYKSITLESSLAVYIIALLSFVGWILLVIFGGVGIFALPIDLINQFRHRPKPRRSSEMRNTKEKMAGVINTLMADGEELKKADEEHANNTEAGWIERFSKGRQVNQRTTEFKARFDALQEQFRIFNLELQYEDSNPIVPFMKLLLGCIFILTSFLWFLQIILGNIAKGHFGRPLVPFFNELLIYMEERNAGFVGTAIFAYLCLYMVWCVQKGNIKFGIRIPCCCRFHPMKQNQTWMNSFMFNVIMLLIASVGVIQLCISSFPTYTRNTDIFMIFGVQINHMRFYSFFYNNSIFPFAFIIWAVLTLIYQLFTCNSKPAYMKDIERIRENEVAQD